MSRQIQLVPELQQLFDDWVSVHERFEDLGKAFVSQQIKLRQRETELEKATKEITALRSKLTENEAIVKSYNQLKADYELLHTASENNRDLIHTENKKRVQELEEELKSARAKSMQQVELQQSRVTQIVADYEAKLRDADQKIRQLNYKFRDDTPRAAGGTVRNVESTSSVLNKKPPAPAGGGKSYLRKWPKLTVDIQPTTLATRARGRGRGAASKRKLYRPNNEGPIDVD